MSLPSKVLFILLIGWLTSCSSPNSEHSQQPDEKTLLEVSQQRIGKPTYERIRRALKDSLQNWVAHDLTAYLALRLYPYALDTLMCFNNKQDKLVTALAFQCPTPDCRQDNVWYFYGVKIKERWYYFSGPTMVLPRSDLSRPTPFAELHEQAVAHIFRAYLRKDASGQWRINDHFFADISSKAYCAHCRTQAQWDSAHLQIATNIWRYGRGSPPATTNH